MALPSDYDMVKDDYLYFDGTETVTVTPLSGSPESEVVALQEPVSGTAWEVVATGSQSNWLVWVLFDATLNSLVPKPGFKVTDGDGNVWVINEAKPMTFRTRWKCLCLLATT